MPENNLNFDFSDLTPGDLEARRRALSQKIREYPGGTDACPMDWLRENAALCQALRRHTAGPPRATKPAKSTAAPTADLLSDI